MLFKTLTLPNRLSLNLFSGNLVINIFIFPLLDHLLTQLVCYSFIIILIYEINNGSLQLFIFSLLSKEAINLFIRYLFRSGHIGMPYSIAYRHAYSECLMA